VGEDLIIKHVLYYQACAVNRPCNRSASRGFPEVVSGNGFGQGENLALGETFPGGKILL
jgi:hypothetical protein